MLAGNEIVLKPGFQARAGSEFWALVPNFEALNNARKSGRVSQIEVFANTSNIRKLNVSNHPEEPDFRDLEVKMNRSLQRFSNRGHLDETLIAYPNPTNGNFVIDCELALQGDVSIEIKNQMGVQVYYEQRKNVNKGKRTLPLSVESLHNGIYFLSVTANGKTQTGRILIID